ncbi:MAG TPA: class I adenylate-forming enzyme family protein [Fervidobacterium sp.]|nr:class I adenylate-forming enzyme family protein [Fervidobacterium sp.]HRD20769.1 class I adenylate-forming enzyme family protein [Fervidobacterium sp.]
MGLFLYHDGQETTYEQLINDINKQTSLKRYVKKSDPYEILKDIVVSLVAGERIILLDSDFTEEEVKNLGLSVEELNEEVVLKKNKISSCDELLAKIQKSDNRWEIVLYTSGTTGRPKRVAHKLDSITRGTKVSEKYRENVWAFAYNPTHFAGLQVFFQAFYNQNPMIYIFDVNRKEVENVLRRYNVTHISATPTFYRSILPYIREVVPSVERATMGGEKYDKNLEAQLLKVFPNADVRNVYASTEAGSIFSAKGDIFSISPRIADKVRFAEDGELLIHKSLLGESDTFQLDEDWYRTGDIVEMIDESHFKFVSRKTEMINIGGYKVNPHEVEDEIKKIDGVVDVIVKARSNRITGNILVAEVKINDGIDKREKEKEITKILEKRLQSWKIPRIFTFVDNIELTRTGKKVRK